MTIAIIDSGYSGSRKERIAGGISVKVYGEKVLLEEEYDDVCGHGTAVTDLILDKCDDDIKVFVIRVLDSEEKCSSRELLEAFKYILSDVECNLVHVSAGVCVCDEANEFKWVIDALYRKNVYVIAAYSNEGVVTYPAAFEKVVGVDLSKRKLRKNQYEFVEGSVVNYRTSASFYRINWNNKMVIASGSSFSSTVISAKYAEVMKRNPKLRKEELDDVVKRDAVYVYRQKILPQLPSVKTIAKEIKRAIVFPFNKEVFQIAANEELCTFEVRGYYTFRQDINIGKRVCDVLTYCSNEKLIQNFRSINWEDDFDTLILGHCDEIEAMTNDNVIDKVLNLCEKHQKKVYSLGNIMRCVKSKEMFQKIAFPYIDCAFVPQNRFGKLRKTGKPVLALCGTSSKQGKFHAQLELRKRFLEDGYNLYQISTEPTGYLFGMDFVYPMGYDSSVYIFGNDAVMVLNDIFEEADNKEAAIVFAGCQSGTLPFRYYNTSNLTIQQTEFLMALNPDAVVLCINYNDDLKYIERTKEYIESINVSKVVAMVMIPIRYELHINTLKKIELDKREKDDMVNKIWGAFGLKLFFLGIDSDMEDLYNTVINFFVED